MKTCFICGSNDENMKLTVENRHICTDCVDVEDYIKCDDCGLLCQSHVELHHRFYCDYCISAHAKQCNDCQEWSTESHPIYNCHSLSYSVCGSCVEDYQTCDHCGRLQEYDYNMHCDGNHSYCEDCYSEYYITCEACDTITRDYREYNDRYYCLDCYSSRYSGIRPYNYIPYDLLFLKHHEEINNNLFMGIELEIDRGGHDCQFAQFLEQMVGDRIFCKEDGSIDNGFEIVSHPATLKYHTNLFGWDKIVSACLNKGYRSHDANTCGLHIHLSRKGFGRTLGKIDLNIAKLLLFFEKNWIQLIKFSRRTNSQLTQWANRYGLSPNEGAMQLLDRAKNSGKYYAINLKHSDTVEIRIFRGTLRKETIYASMQFMQALVDICKATDINDVPDLTFVDVYEEAQCRGYEELVHELTVRRKIIDTAKLESYMRQEDMVKLPRVTAGLPSGTRVMVVDATATYLSTELNFQYGTILEETNQLHRRTGSYPVILDSGYKWYFMFDSLVLTDEPKPELDIAEGF